MAAPKKTLCTWIKIKKTRESSRKAIARFTCATWVLFWSVLFCYDASRLGMVYVSQKVSTCYFYCLPFLQFLYDFRFQRRFWIPEQLCRSRAFQINNHFTSLLAIPRWVILSQQEKLKKHVYEKMVTQRLCPHFPQLALDSRF